MKERVKSLMLVALVVCSLIQSYFLIYRLPGNERVVRTESDYVQTEIMGAQAKVEEVIFPQDIIVHLGDSKHTLFYPNTNFYKLILSRLQGRQFDGFQRYTATNLNWNTIREQNEGIELRFGRGVPVGVLQKVMQISNDSIFEDESINRILIYNVKNEDKVRVFFFSSQAGVIYEATNADLTVQDVHQQINFGKAWTPYRLVNGMYYIPEKNIDALDLVVQTGTYTSDQMQRSLSFDPSITRYIQERNGSEIYTDIKRSLQFRQHQNWISYTDPSRRAGSISLNKDALSAVDFVNQYGGWNGTYRMEVTEESDQQSRVLFQQYYDWLPILDLPGFRYGTMRLDMRQGAPTSYERSLIYTKDEKSEKRIRVLPGGEVLNRQIADKAKGQEVSALYPAYQPIYSEKGLRLKPVWVILLGSGERIVL
ncbi:regulatory protein YycH of two-component signal transduction system YycFG [Paenibacillus shirakamiensis]|uniref:Regulatory protein YycH of two-component signal transduction system YycFG n=1 Tax=Paenibacillus shirakamiensis TaxID=1265935 RepID=A0ABS4JKS5_9BACL|nr:two-component system activity regulator YycH [Paenibacillus shirakamiensis]MBP2002320.1 regulatory protein YycH of two-component signal transduction system YycFG [Paenibacillus shirakamiensis]